MGLHLLDLPVELLCQIFRPLLLSRERIQLCPCAGPPADVRPLAVLLAHPAVHAVACPLLYEANVFALDLRGAHGPHVRRCLGEAAAAAAAAKKDARRGPAARDDDDDDDDAGPSAPLVARQQPSPLLLQRSALRRMGRVEVHVGRLRAWVDGLVVPLLADMALGGALVELDVYLHAGGAPRRPSRDAAGDDDDALGRPPMAGLLRVLSDPNLRRARLLRVGAGGREGEEVDWRAVLRRADPDGHHVVAGLGPDVRAARGGY